MTADRMALNQEMIIEKLDSSELTLNLMELGFLPGKKIRLLIIAPLKDPMAFFLDNSIVALRKSEARLIQVSPIH